MDMHDWTLTDNIENWTRFNSISNWQFFIFIEIEKLTSQGYEIKNYWENQILRSWENRVLYWEIEGKNWDFGKNLDNLAKTETILLKMCDNLDNIYVKTE